MSIAASKFNNADTTPQPCITDPHDLSGRQVCRVRSASKNCVRAIKIFLDACAHANHLSRLTPEEQSRIAKAKMLSELMHSIVEARLVFAGQPGADPTYWVPRPNPMLHEMMKVYDLTM